MIMMSSNNNIITGTQFKGMLFLSILLLCLSFPEFSSPIEQQEQQPCQQEVVHNPNQHKLTDDIDDDEEDKNDTKKYTSNSKQMHIMQQQLTHPRQQHPPRCIAADSYHTYICTENSEASRHALHQFASNGGRNENIIPYDFDSLSSSGSKINHNKNNINIHNMDLGVEQRITGSETEQTNTRNVMKKMYVYLEEEVLSRSEYEIVRMNGKCKNKHELCAFWSSVGECETNRGFMLENCTAVCRLCLLVSVNMIA